MTAILLKIEKKSSLLKFIKHLKDILKMTYNDGKQVIISKISRKSETDPLEEIHIYDFKYLTVIIYEDQIINWTFWNN